MSRLNVVDRSTTQPEIKPLFEAVESQLGSVPNFLRVFANSPKALAGILALNGNLGQGLLNAKLQEQIALTVGEANACQYCVSAHTAISQSLGLDATEIEAARQGNASDEKASAAVQFAKALVDNDGNITTGELKAVRDAGYSDGEIVEIITLVGLNTTLNYLGKVSRVEIDFPEVTLLSRSNAVAG